MGEKENSPKRKALGTLEVAGSIRFLEAFAAGEDRPGPARPLYPWVFLDLCPCQVPFGRPKRWPAATDKKGAAEMGTLGGSKPVRSRVTFFFCFLFNGFCMARDAEVFSKA